VTSGFAGLGLMGPQSRALLARLTPAELSDAAFPFGTSREIELGYALVRAQRISYVGELGFELYVQTEFAGPVLDLILEEIGDQVRLAGFHALNSLRLEKGFRSFGHDMGDEDTPFEAGLGFAVAMGKRGGFIGREALLRQRGSGLKRRLVVFTLDDPDAYPVHDEPVYRDDVIAGHVTSADYGHTLGRAVAFAYVASEAGVDTAFVTSGTYEIDIAGERWRATPHLRPPYDPEGRKLERGSA
jgi:4-methylaminobutanoate oxidase (formaldehyde-forming)